MLILIKRMEQTQNKSILYMLYSLMLYSVITVCNKSLINEANIHISQMFFTSSFFALMYTFLYLKFIKRESFYKVALNNINSQYCMRAIFNLLARYFFLYAMTGIDAVLAASLLYFRPIFALLISVCFLGEKLTKRIAFSLLLGILGAFVITGPLTMNKVSIFPMLAAFAAPLMWSVYDVIVKKQTKGTPDHQQVYLLFLLLCVLSFPMAVKHWAPLNLKHLTMFMFLGLIYALTEFTLSKALKGITLTLAAPISFTRIIFTASLAYIVLGEKITTNVLYGGAIIIIATLFLLRPSRIDNPVRENA